MHLRWRTLAVALLLGAALSLHAQWEGSPVDPERERQGPPPEQRVDINHATIDQLLRVPGMTRSWAGRIVRYRPYHSKLDLVQDGVVPGVVYERIRYSIIAHRDAERKTIVAAQPHRRQFEYFSGPLLLPAR